MAKKHSPRHGSMAYSPRKRALRIYPRSRSWPIIKEKTLLGFAGYKAGMTHLFVLDKNKETATSGQEVFTPVTVLECPPIIPFSLRVYSKTPYGLKCETEFFAQNLSKFLNRKISPRKRSKKKLGEIAKLKADEVSLLTHTQPHLAGISKKPEILEIKIGGTTIEEKVEYARELLGKEIRVSDIFKEGEYADVSAVTKGKGTQGVVKRFGVKIQPRKHKRSGKARHVGTLGDRGSATRWTVPQGGQMGYQTRTEFNKRVLKIGSDSKEVTPNGGFLNYGVIKNDYIILKGSVPGPAKRLIRLRKSIRKHTPPEEPEITYVSLTSKQGK